MSEEDYRESSEPVAEKLTDLFGRRGSAVLIVGSSLTDPPLLTALGRTRNNPQKYAVVPAQGFRLDQAISAADSARLKDMMKLRGEHFGLRLLIPDFYSQAAQFCEEVLTCLLAPGGTGSYLDDSQKLGYGQRLMSWWERWTASPYGTDPAAVNRKLAETAAFCQSLLLSRQRSALTKEPLKVELWVRHNPSETEQLRLWGTSAAVITDQYVMPAEQLQLGSGHAPTRAFIEGRPELVEQEQLVAERVGDYPAERREWKTFLSVPIRLDYSQVDLPVGTPVGVITLATMRTVEETGIPFGNGREMFGLVKILLDCGHEILEA